MIDCYKRVRGLGQNLHLAANNMQDVFQYHFSRRTVVAYMTNSPGELTGKFTNHIRFSISCKLLVTFTYCLLLNLPPANVPPFHLAISEPESLRLTLSKGYCLILNFREFQFSPDDIRGISKIDVETLQNTFRQLGAVVRTQSDLTSDQVKRKILPLKGLIGPSMTT